VPFAEDQDAVGESGSDGRDESFGEAVRSRASSRIFTVSIPAGQHTVEGCGEAAGPVADEEPEGGGALVKIHQ
jgi:hypothetical protein